MKRNKIRKIIRAFLLTTILSTGVNLSQLVYSEEIPNSVAEKLDATLFSYA